MKGFTTNDPDAVERLIIGSKPSTQLRDDALEQLRKELAQIRRERDRWAARVILLEARIDAIRGIAK